MQRNSEGELLTFGVWANNENGNQGAEAICILDGEVVMANVVIRIADRGIVVAVRTSPRKRFHARFLR